MMYVKFNEDGTYGFYNVEFHGEEIISNPEYIEITNEAYEELMENQGIKSIGYVGPDVDLIDSSFIVDSPEIEDLGPTERELRLSQLDLAINLLVEALPDDKVEPIIHQIPLIFNEWESFIGSKLDSGKIVRYQGNLYRVRMDIPVVLEHQPPSVHTSALYLMMRNPDEEGQVLPWEDRWAIQKEGYLEGDVVTHKGFYWTSNIGVAGNWNYFEPTEANWSAWTKGEHA